MTKRLQKEGIKIWYNTKVKEMRGNNKVETVVLVNNKTASEDSVDESRGARVYGLSDWKTEADNG